MTPKAAEMRRPALIVVAGRPGAGKTTLAHALARAARCPAVCRDEIKEGLVCTGGDGEDLQLRATDAFFDVLALLLGRGVTLVAEAAFQHGVWASRLEPLLAVARVCVVLCEVDAELARARGRAPGSYDPPRLEVPLLRVDTSDGYRPAFDAIVAFARG